MSGSQGVDHVGGADARSTGAEGPIGGGVGIGAYDEVTRADVAMLGQKLVADPPAGVVEGGDAESRDVFPDALVDGRRRLRGGRHQMVDDDHDPVRIKNLIQARVTEQVEHLGGEDVVQQGQVDLGHDELPGGHLVPSGRAGQNAFREVHPHGVASTLNLPPGYDHHRRRASVRSRTRTRPRPGTAQRCRCPQVSRFGGPGWS